VQGYQYTPGARSNVWPTFYRPLTTAELVVGTLAPRSTEEKTAGPFEWSPIFNHFQQDCLLMVASATGDPSNIAQFTAGETIPEWRLVPSDNNLGLRVVTPSSPGENRDAGGAYAEGVRRAAAAEEGPARWGMRRHAAIAEAAMERLQSGAARRAIQRLFDESGETSLGEVAEWADKIKTADRPRDPATERFLADPRNRSRDTWHYVNLPLGLDGYDRERHPEFTRDHDVVQTILAAVEALRNPGPNARFEEINALRLICHLVGDVHQPVHVGCGYIADARTQQAHLVFSPESAIGLGSDKGGGELRLPIGGNLHGYWDSNLGPDLVPDALAAESDAGLVGALAKAGAARGAADELPIPERVASWATASLVAAREAYKSLRIVRYQPNHKGDYVVEWEGEEAYQRRCEPIVSERMSSAAANLAALLDTIWTV
jgi:hypothetical protein